MSDAVASTAVPRKIVGIGPKRSVSRPDTGDRAYIPSVWPDSTMPTSVREWPCSVMWSGVIVMIRTITNWPTTSAMIAALTPGRRRIATMLSLVVTPEAASAASVSASASWYGSGRRKVNDRIAARPTNTTGTR